MSRAKHTDIRLEPLEQVIDELTKILRTHHIWRLQNGECNIETGFVLSDVLTNLERISDHCSNIAGCVIDRRQDNMNLHESLNAYRRSSEEFETLFRSYQKLYQI